MLPTLRRAGVLTAAILALHAPATAQLRTGHAIPGFYGLESSVPPPLGLSFDNTTLVYNSSRQQDRYGNTTPLTGSISHVSNHSTLTWLSPWLLLGGNWVMRFQLPLVNSETNPPSIETSGSGFGLGDIMIEPIALYWEGRRHYIHTNYQAWLPTGEFRFGENDNKGKGYLTHQASLGVTFFPAKKRDWHISVLGRYEFHDDVEGADLTPGQDVIVDWSVGKHLDEKWNVGVVGYGVWQTTKESGADGITDQGLYGTAAAGAEVRYGRPDLDLEFHVRALQQFNAFNLPEGAEIFFGVDFAF